MRDLPSWLEQDRRQTPRFSVCARVELLLSRHMSEHIVYDLSLGGMRLCGVPDASVGDRVCALVHLPSAPVVLSGSVLRAHERASPRSFAVQFDEISSEAECAIETAFAETRARQGEPSMLSVETPVCRSYAQDWLAPLGSACARASSALNVNDCLARYRIEVGVLREACTDIPDWEWNVIYPEQMWRTMDQQGRLHVPQECDAG